MAKFSISGDTEKEEVVVDVNGEKFADVQVAGIYWDSYEKCWCFHCQTMTEDDAGVKKFMNVRANKNEFVKNEDVEAEIAAYLEKRNEKNI